MSRTSSWGFLWCGCVSDSWEFELSGLMILNWTMFVLHASISRRHWCCIHISSIHSFSQRKCSRNQADWGGLQWCDFINDNLIRRPQFRWQIDRWQNCLFKIHPLTSVFWLCACAVLFSSTCITAFLSFTFGLMPDRELASGICLPVRLYPNAKFENKEQRSNCSLK